jgi:DNA-binding transcriptional LysR family regulator
MRPLPTELLRSFVIVADTANFTVASERVSLSQSTGSREFAI